MAAVNPPPRRIVKADAGVNLLAISSLEGQVRDDRTPIICQVLSECIRAQLVARPKGVMPSSINMTDEAT